MADAAEDPSDPRGDARRALEAFVVEHADLETLEGLVEQFNVFEALGDAAGERDHPAADLATHDPGG